MYRFVCLVCLKFELFEIKAAGMSDVRTEPQFEAEVELKLKQERETMVKSASALCVSVGTQCEQKREDDSIIVMKFSYSDAEDPVAVPQEDTQVVSVSTFNTLCTDSEPAIWAK
jgi:hypothetical protein